MEARISGQLKKCDDGDADNSDEDVLTNICFADDSTLVFEDPADLQIMIEELQAAMKFAGLKFAISKCVCMTTWAISELLKLMTLCWNVSKSLCSWAASFRVCVMRRLQYNTQWRERGSTSGPTNLFSFIAIFV